MIEPATGSGRHEGGIIFGLVLLWLGLWLVPQYLWIPIPPFREDPRWTNSTMLGVLAYVWATLLLLIPGILPVWAGCVTGRLWKRSARLARLGLMGLSLLAMLPLVVIGTGILRRMTESPFTDSVASPLFYWWPR